MNEEKQPIYPLVNLNLSPAGLTITLSLTPTTMLTQVIPPDAVDELVVRWREHKKAQREEQAIIEAVKRESRR
jgi:hypothetical protein